MQDVLALALVALALAWLVGRTVVRRRRATCCGAKQCPAATRMVDGFAPPPAQPAGRGARKVP